VGLGAIIFLILANGFFVAGEFALVGVERARIEELAQDGHRGAVSTLRALKTLSFQLSGAQLGITITSLLIGFITEPTLGRALAPLVERVGIGSAESAPELAIAIALIVATACQMVVSELIPQNLSIAHPNSVAYVLATPLRMFNAMLKPIIVVLNGAANWTVRLMGIEPRDELTNVHSLEELELLIRSSKEEGSLAEEDFALLARSINFPRKTAADALTPRTSIVALPAAATLEDLTVTALECGHSRIPVFEEDLDNIIGIAHIKDIYAFEPGDRPSVRVTTIMRDALEVPESKSLDSLLVEMRRDRKQMAIVVDEYGGTAGIITLEDLLEEIVGEIEDEYDPGAPTVGRAVEGVHVVSGMLHRDEVRETTGLVLPEGDYDTLAGFLLGLFDRIPKAGDQISFEDWEFKVTEMDGNRIAQVLVVVPPEPKNDEGTDR
jgi:CBS domain containing-hemolysin-like protein